MYLGRNLANPQHFVAIKILRDEFLKRDDQTIMSVQNEINILQSLDHSGIVRMLEFGDSGSVLKPSGRVIPNLVYIMMEFV